MGSVRTLWASWRISMPPILFPTTFLPMIFFATRLQNGMLRYSREFEILISFDVCSGVILGCVDLSTPLLSSVPFATPVSSSSGHSQARGRLRVDALFKVPSFHCSQRF